MTKVLSHQEICLSWNEQACLHWKEFGILLTLRCPGHLRCGSLECSTEKTPARLDGKEYFDRRMMPIFATR